jgi:hypothetical protein
MPLISFNKQAARQMVENIFSKKTSRAFAICVVCDAATSGIAIIAVSDPVAAADGVINFIATTIGGYVLFAMARQKSKEGGGQNDCKLFHAGMLFHEKTVRL